jgi:hypothetical protein
MCESLRAGTGKAGAGLPPPVYVQPFSNEAPVQPIPGCAAGVGAGGFEPP